MTNATELSSLCAEDISRGTAIPGIELPITVQRVIMNAAVTWDWFPGHHNPYYAVVQGQPSIYVSSLFIGGFADRCVTDWAGPGVTVTRRRLRIVRSICAGQLARAKGSVVDIVLSERCGVAEIDVEISGDGVKSAEAKLTVEFPLRHRAALTDSP